MDAQSNYSDDLFIEEKIDGKIYLMARSSEKHTDVQYNIANIFNDYFRKNKKKCISRIEAELWINKDSWVVPDVMVFCYNTSKNLPLIIVEVLSKSTRKKDLGVKMKKYAELGIKEYWVVDCTSYTIDIYVLTENNIYDRYESYSYYTDEDFSKMPGIRERQRAEVEIITEFTPVSFPELKVLLEDVFYFVEY